jgi:hypothetical protein
MSSKKSKNQENEDKFFKQWYKEHGELEYHRKIFNAVIVGKLKEQNMFVAFLPVTHVEPEHIVIDSKTNIKYEQVGYGIEENGILIAPCLSVRFLPK